MHRGGQANAWGLSRSPVDCGRVGRRGGSLTRTRDRLVRDPSRPDPFPSEFGAARTVCPLALARGDVCDPHRSPASGFQRRVPESGFLLRAYGPRVSVPLGSDARIRSRHGGQSFGLPGARKMGSRCRRSSRRSEGAFQGFEHTLAQYLRSMDSRLSRWLRAPALGVGGVQWVRSGLRGRSYMC